MTPTNPTGYFFKTFIATLAVATLALPLGALAQSRPTLHFGNANNDLLLSGAYAKAQDNVLRINRVEADANHRRSGLLTGSPAYMIRAGGGYSEAWTRDASVNSWNAASLLAPELARNTLWAVVEKQANGQLIIQQDNQWWDQVVWTIAAWNHYAVTGDKAFLAKAYEAANNALIARKAKNYNANYKLFKGASFFNDGISGYPTPPADTGETRGGFVLDYPLTLEQMPLSTNVIYYQAYKLAGSMAEALGKPRSESDAHKAMSTSLYDAINQRFWNSTKSSYAYLIRGDGTRDDYEEGTGLSFAMLFGVADVGKTAAILKNTHVQKWGITDVYPNFARYSDARPGRHNAIVWPMVQGYWADAAARGGAQDVFAKEVARLAKLGNNNSGFWEIHNAQNGVIDGGYQLGGHWGSQPDQTWSASAYIRMVHNGLFGLDMDPDGLTFRPTLPAGWGDVSLTGLVYRGATLDINLRGSGNVISSFTIDGATSSARIASSLTGKHVINITLSGATEGDRDGDGVLDSADKCPDEAGSSALGGCPDPVLLEAEDATNTGGPVMSREHAGYTGRGFVEAPRKLNAAISLSVHRASAPTANHRMKIRYANGNADARTLSVYVNGQRIRQLSFAPSGGWDKWLNLETDLNLSGNTSSVALRYDTGDSGSINIDSAAFSLVGAPTGKTLKGAESGRCLQAASADNNSGVMIFDCGTSANQQWIRGANGTLETMGKCLDVFNSSSTPGAAIGLWTCHGGTNQQWRFNADNTVVGVQSGLCLDVSAHATGNNSKVSVWTCSGGANQKWTQ
jgi:glycogen debranching enzyme